MKIFFEEHFQKHRAFPETLRQVFREFSLLTYFPLTINYWSTSITSNIDFWKIIKVLCSRSFHIFQNIPLKYSSLSTYVQIILKRLWLYVIIMSHMRFRVNLNSWFGESASIVAWMSSNSLLETDPISEVGATATGFEPINT